MTGPGERKTFGPITLGLVPVSVSNTVIGYLRRELSGEVIDFVELDMPTTTLDTKAVMCTITPEALQDNGVEALRACDQGQKRRFTATRGPRHCEVLALVDGEVHSGQRVCLNLVGVENLGQILYLDQGTSCVTHSISSSK